MIAQCHRCRRDVNTDTDEHHYGSESFVVCKGCWDALKVLIGEMIDEGKIVVTLGPHNKRPPPI